MAAKTMDVNKSTIMHMLRTDVFGFVPDDIESKAKEAFNLVANQATKVIGGYNRDNNGYIKIFRSEGKTKTSRKK